MTSAEFDLLRTFCERPGRVLSRDSLLDLTQGRNAGSFERSIDVLVSRIRRKIEPDPQDATMIKTVRSGGYMFTPTVDAVTGAAERPVMKLLGFLNLRGISGQIAALVIASIVAIHLIITATFLLHRPDQLDPSIDRGHSQLAAAVALLGATPAARTAAAVRRLSRGHFRNLRLPSLPARSGRRGERTGQIPTCAACVATSAAATGSFRSATTPTPTRSASCCRTALPSPPGSRVTSGSVRSGAARG